MTFRTDSLRLAAGAVCARDGVDLAGLAAVELVQLSGQVAQLRRDADVLMAVVAAEIRRRTEDVDLGSGLAGRQGFRSAKEMIAHTTGGTLTEARRLIATGDLLTGAESLPDSVPSPDSAAPTGSSTTEPAVTDPSTTEPAATGSPISGPSAMDRFRADLASAVRDGQISVDAAALFTDAIKALPESTPHPRLADPSDTDTDPVAASSNEDRTYALFQKALRKASGLPVHQVRKLVWQAQAHADPEAWKEREDRQHEARSLTVRDDTDGMVTLTARLTPLGAAPVRAVLDAGVRSAMQTRRENPDTDQRTPWQMKADILTDLCRHALDCDHATSGVKTTVVIRMNLADLDTGLGIGDIDGTPQPVSTETLRHAAADAHIIPAILGGPSDILDWGRARRLFTPTQRLALVERDGGCAWCNAPPTWCEAHHIQWWQRDTGPTDLDNAILLCAQCHHRIHRDGWDIQIRNNIVHFIPPPTVDPTQTPRIGGRQRYDLAA